MLGQEPRGWSRQIEQGTLSEEMWGAGRGLDPRRTEGHGEDFGFK